MAEAGSSELDISKIGERLRPYLGVSELDTLQTSDKLGIFSCNTKEGLRLVGWFLVGLLDQALAIERGLAQITSQYAPEGEKFSNLQKLVSAFSKISYWPDASAKQKDHLYFSESAGESGKAKKRFHIQSVISKYNPRSISPLEIPVHLYNFEQPAYMETRVTNEETKETLVFAFFPLRYSRYWIATKNGRRDFPGLDGVSYEQAKEILREQPGLSPEQIHEALQNGREDLVEPYFRLSLENQYGQRISAIEGKVLKNNIPKLDLSSSDFPDLSVDLPIPGAKKNENNPLGYLSSEFMGLEIKSPANKKRAFNSLVKVV